MKQAKNKQEKFSSILVSKKRHTQIKKKSIDFGCTLMEMAEIICKNYFDAKKPE